MDNIGITLTDGSNNAPVNLLNVSACGFGQGFQVGGEHVVMVNCSATFGLYGFTFGNYPYHCAFNHPITMINCCDEQCRFGPRTDPAVASGRSTTPISRPVRRPSACRIGLFVFA